MHTVASQNVVLVRGIDEQIGIGAGIHARLHERKGMLRHAGVVMVVVDDEQMSFQVTGKVFQVCLLVAFRVRLRSVHSAHRTLSRSIPSR